MIKARKLNNHIDEVKSCRYQMEENMVEEALSNLEMEILFALENEKNPPKYTVVPIILTSNSLIKELEEKEYFIDIDGRGSTRIFYNQEDFNNRVGSRLPRPMYITNNGDNTVNVNTLNMNIEVCGEAIAEMAMKHIIRTISISSMVL